ncbi:BglG family transcription antiterminator [Enterococcus sp. RIT-PI-f]|uniref:BglG family transcription antiterminator n=1 Tax=Enterococcus sp. RIT-PI-f TaxID=1690244 RepID=UPI0006B9B686|nr:PRD domain-containing protein [Enterococcus sp. RIT-PI-f]KPG71971.1 transcription antiterminator BglG [Enterococcus sp. RIT-PI-f]
MFLTKRETILLTELMNSAGPVSLDRMMQVLKVSKRTLYRELANLENSLQRVDASLEKSGRGAFQIIASEQGFRQLQEAIMTDTGQEFAANERQHHILLQLTMAKEPVSIHDLLATYQISNTTFFADIKQLEESLARLPLRIVRNQGYEIQGSEKYRRLVTANTMVMEINEYQFFHLPEAEEQERSVFQFISRTHLLLAQRLVREMIEPKFTELSDRKLAFIILMLALAMDRVEQGHAVEEETYPSQLNKGLLKAAKQVFGKVAEQTKLLYSINEIVFFAVLLGDFANSFDRDFFDENFDTDLAYRVKRLIEGVSKQTEAAFYEDTNLYKMLLTHISGVMTRAILEENQLNNPILEKIMNQYVEIAAAIRSNLPHIFSQQQFSEEEIAYMVLHFANSLEKNPKVLEVNIAGVSPSGLASISLLEMQLRKHFPFINQITFFRVGDVQREKIEEHYDLIISTSLLPGYQGNYQLVSPILLDEDIKKLKTAFQEISQQKHSAHKAPPQASKSDTYEEVLAFIDAINALLALFRVEMIDNSLDLEQTLAEVMARFERTLIADPKKVAEKLLKRYLQAPVGIPDTHVALFHASSSAILAPVFRIFDLRQPLELFAMDKKEITVTRLLVMLAPYPINEKSSQMLGKISGSIIMNDLNTEIFNSGNESIIYQLLSSLLIEEVKQ